MNESDQYSGTPPLCHILNQINSRGLMVGDDPLSFSLPSLLLQSSLICIIIRSIHFLLKPVGQPFVVAQILGGVIIGPSVLGRNPSFLSKVFPRKSRVVLDTISVFGFMLFIFIIGVKMDISIVARSGRKALAVGILGFFVPFGLASFVAFLLAKFSSLDHDLAKALPHIIAMLSMTAFTVITCFLDELKILNSDIGRLASSSSVICDVCLWLTISTRYAADLAKTCSVKTFVGTFLSVGLFILFVVFMIQPAALWIVRNTPESRPVKESYIFITIIILLFSGLIGEVIGIHAFTASLSLGLVVPDGPPFGSGLVETLDCFVSMVLMPLFFTISGLQIDVYSMHSLQSIGVIMLVVLVAFFGKIMGSMLPLVFYRMPFRDALSLGLIMSSKGFLEVAFLNDMKNRQIVTEEIYTITMVLVVAITGVVSPIVKLLYDPSKRFIAYKRRTIMHCTSNDELRILACIYRQENVPPLISILRVSNPTKESSSINLVVLHLIKLVARSSSLLVAHRQKDDKPSHRNLNQSERIFNAFKKFEQQNLGNFHVNCYKGISPSTTMYNDVCSLALEKRTILIILPFHKQWIFEETREQSNMYRNLNKHVLEKAPCSVGILIDHRSRVKSQYVAASEQYHQIVVLFFGGADDREALAYALRMSGHPRVRLTLIRFVNSGPTSIVAGTERSKMLDDNILSSFKLKMPQTEHLYKEKTVRNGTDVMIATRSMVNDYNLVLVGRRHGESPIMHQLARWKERGELGAIGEILAASEFKGETSILVMQQQTKLWGLKDPEESTHLRRVKL